jgi:hypothetical protein
MEAVSSREGYLPCSLVPHYKQAFTSTSLILRVRELTTSLVLFIVALGTSASYTSAFAPATPAALVHRAHAASTLTLSLTVSPSASGAPTSQETYLYHFGDTA